MRSSLRLALVLGAATLALVAAACGGGGTSEGASSCGTQRAAPSTRSAQRVPHFSHVVMVVFENKEYNEVIGSAEAPTFNRLARAGAVMTTYCAVAHPSMPNYLALVSGSTHGITDDCTDCAVDGRDLADELERQGLTWKTYAEGLPETGFTGARAGRYAKKHDPFVYFRDVSASRRRLRRIVPLSQLTRDMAAGTLPTFALVIPDLCHDMHDCAVSDGDRWLRAFLPPLLRRPQLRHAVVFTVFDEGDKSDHSGGGGHTIALADGATVRPGSRSTAPLTHYNLLRTIEDGLRLPPLGRSRSAHAIAGIWR